MMNKGTICCVCRKRIEGNPHNSPEGVFICSEGCFSKWAQAIRFGYELQTLTLALCGPEKVNPYDVQRITETYQWLEDFEKNEKLFYVR